MPIGTFTTELAEGLRRGSIDPSVRTEQALERRFVIPVAARIAARHPDTLVFTHPFRNTRRCSNPCTCEPPPAPGRVFGCPRCWALSKPWASVAAFGTHHTFDLVAKDHSHTLANELKLVVARGDRMPNAEVQRFLGQCSLAATKHSSVIGFCVHRGAMRAKWREDTAAATKWFAGRNVQLVFRPVACPV
jgi:hypothetical protein